MLRRIHNRFWTFASQVNGRVIDRFWIRPIFSAIDPNATILEIGGGYNPRFTRDRFANVFHLDHASTEELKAKYEIDPNVSHLVHQIQEVDFISDGSPIEGLIPEKLRFDVIFSSHALEHQVDLIAHFQSLEKLLKRDGRVVIVIPDYRCCFDALRYPTVVSDAISVHRRGARVHQDKQIFDHITRTIDVNPIRKLRQLDVAAARFNNRLRDGVDAVARSEQPGAEYEDTHAWTFFPPSFRLLLHELYMLGYTRLRTTQVSPIHGNQFCTVLQRDDRYSSPPVEIMDELESERLRLTKKARRV